MLKWIVVIAVAVAILIIASAGRIPGTGRQLAVSDDTRTAAAIAHTPQYTRQQAIALVAEYIQENCNDADRYLTNLDSFEARWMRNPRSNDFYERGYREWTVSDPKTGAYWRLYEDNDEIVDVRENC